MLLPPCAAVAAAAESRLGNRQQLIVALMLAAACYPVIGVAIADNAAATAATGSDRGEGLLVGGVVPAVLVLVSISHRHADVALDGPNSGEQDDGGNTYSIRTAAL